jgi:alpha-glucosidase
VRTPPRPLPGWPCDFQPEGTDCTAAGLTERDLETLNSRDGFSGTEEFVWAPKRQDGQQQGLPDRDLLYPKYPIHNKAAYGDDWNADKGGISNKTVNTDLIHQNGLAMYDVSKLTPRTSFILHYGKV